MKRRQFIAQTTKAAGGLVLGASLSGFHRISHKLAPSEKLGVALVGLGSYSSGQLAPALLETDFCQLRGIVTGTPSKAATWAEKYQIPEKNIYSYDNFDDIADNADIDIVYVVLPNAMHAEFTIRAAEAGKHVICEKPMATSYEDCLKMIASCHKAGKMLSIGYRLHYDPFNLEVMRFGQQAVFGQVHSLDSGFGFRMKHTNNWRTDKVLAGGGPLMDVGIYALQCTLYSLGQLPVRLRATDTTRDKSRFPQVEGSLESALFFESGVKATIKTSYEDNYSFTRATAAKGTWQMSPAFYYGGISGSSSLGEMTFKPVNQQALQMDAFAQCILKNQQTLVPGLMGARDVFIMEKIYESATSQQEVSLKGVPDCLHLLSQG